jgi:hypothetical protein
MGRRPTARHLEPCQDELRRRDSWRSGAREGDWVAGYASSSSGCWEGRRVEEELSEGDGEMKRARVRVKRTPVSPAPPFHLQGCSWGDQGRPECGGERGSRRAEAAADDESGGARATAACWHGNPFAACKEVEVQKMYHSCGSSASDWAGLPEPAMPAAGRQRAVCCVGWLECQADNLLDGSFLIFTPYPPASAAATASQPAVAATFLSSAVTPPLLALSQLPLRLPSPLPCLSPVSLSVPRVSPLPPTPPAPSRSRPPSVAVRRRRPSSRVPERPRAWCVPSQRLWPCGPRLACPAALCLDRLQDGRTGTSLAVEATGLTLAPLPSASPPSRIRCRRLIFFALRPLAVVRRRRLAERPPRALPTLHVYARAPSARACNAPLPVVARLPLDRPASRPPCSLRFGSSSPRTPPYPGGACMTDRDRL